MNKEPDLNDIYKFTNLDSFELKGAWALDYDDIRTDLKRQYGTFTFDRGSATLIIFGSMEKLAFFDQKMYSDIYGLELNGAYLHLLNNISIGGSETFNDTQISEQIIRTNYFSIANTPPDNRWKRNELQYDFNYSNKFFPVLSDQTKNPEKNSVTYKNTLKQDKEVGFFSYKGMLFKLMIGGSFRYNNDISKRTFNLTNLTFLRLIGETNISPKFGLEIANELEDLFSIIIGRRCNSKRIVLTNKVDKDFFENLYFSPRHSINTNSDYSGSRNYNYNLFEADFKSIVASWFIKSDELRIISNDYLRTLDKRQSYQDQYINLMQGIDSFFRKYDHFSLKDKIESMIYELPTVFKQIIEKNLNQFSTQYKTFNKWLKATVSTRVYYTHGTERSDRMTDLRDILINIDIFKYLVQAYILYQLGFNNWKALDIKGKFDEIYSLKIIK